MREYAEKNNLKKCPACKALVGLASGCQYIDCMCGVKWCFNCVDIFDPVTNKCNTCAYQHGFNAINKRVTDSKPCPNNKCGVQVKKKSGGNFEQCP